MFLTPNNIAAYLVDRGLATSSSIVNEHFFLVEVGRRNRNFKVYLGNQKGLFVKQIKSVDPQAISTLQREAGFYHRLRESRLDGEVQQIVPRMVQYDSTRHILTMELLHDSESLAESHSRDIRHLHETSRRLAEGVAVLHSQLALIMRSMQGPFFPMQLPWAICLDQSGYQPIQQLGPVGVQLASALQRIPGIDLMLGSLRSLWQWETVIHGDMKWENALLDRADPAAPLRVVDWELVDVGDSAWDVASLLKEHVVYGLFTLLNAGAGSGQQPIVNTEDVRQVCAASSRELFQHYVNARRLPAASLPFFAGRCIRYTAARLVMAVLEYLYSSPASAQVTDMMLQTAVSFLQYPQQTAVNLLGTAAV